MTNNAALLCHIVTPVGMLGYGMDENVTGEQLAELTATGIPTAIILDSGSTDSGPAKLAFGSTTCPRAAYLNDLTKLLALVHKFNVPLIFSSAGGAGTDEHVQMMLEIIDEIAARPDNGNYCFKAVSILSTVGKETVLSRLKDGRVKGCGPCVPLLSEADVVASTTVVAQAGPEPFIDAMEQNPDFDIIIGGRAYDPAPYTAYCAFQLKRRYPALKEQDIDQRWGGFLHMGKILECGGLCSLPKSMGAVASVYEDGKFDVWPLDSASSCTSLSVAAHALYENARPDLLHGPGGSLLLNDSCYDELGDGRTVRVSGSRFRHSNKDGRPYQIKLEAARTIGYRTMFMGTIKDEILVGQIDALIVRIRQYVAVQHVHVDDKWELEFHIYGNRHVGSGVPAEIFIVVETLASTQELATSIASKARVGMIHGSYPGQKATAGNFGFSMGEIPLGQCAQFSVYHLMDLEPGEERLAAHEAEPAGNHPQIFRSRVNNIGRGRRVLSIANLASGSDYLHHKTSRVAISTKGDGNIATIESPPNNPKTLADVSRILRSKNAGPYEITIDVMFFTKEIYHRIQNSDLLSAETISKALNVRREDIIWMGFFEPALAFKVTIPRFRCGKMTSAGSFMEEDMHGSQQHTSIAQLKLPDKY